MTRARRTPASNTGPAIDCGRRSGQAERPGLPRIRPFEHGPHERAADAGVLGRWVHADGPIPNIVERSSRKLLPTIRPSASATTAWKPGWGDQVAERERCGFDRREVMREAMAIGEGRERLVADSPAFHPIGGRGDPHRERVTRCDVHRQLRSRLRQLDTPPFRHGLIVATPSAIRGTPAQAILRPRSRPHRSRARRG